MGSLMISVAPSLRVSGALRTTPSLLGSAGHGGSPLKLLSRVTDSLNRGSFVAGSPAPTDMDQANPASIAESPCITMGDSQWPPLRRPHSPSPSQRKRVRIEEAPMEPMARLSTHDTPGPLSPSPSARHHGGKGMKKRWKRRPRKFS